MKHHELNSNEVLRISNIGNGGWFPELSGMTGTYVDDGDDLLCT